MHYRRDAVVLEETKTRMGHDDMRAALRYQRATTEVDEAIADRISRLINESDWGPVEDATEEHAD